MSLKKYQQNQKKFFEVLKKLKKIVFKKSLWTPSKVGSCWLPGARSTLSADLHIAHSLHWLLQCALCCYQSAKARTLCACNLNENSSSQKKGSKRLKLLKVCHSTLISLAELHDTYSGINLLIFKFSFIRDDENRSLGPSLNLDTC